MLELLPLVVAAGWASGLNPYMVVLLIGLAGRFELGGTPLPATFSEPWVLIAAGVLALLHIIADKVPYLDSAWDAVHTFIRPVLGAAIGLVLSGESDDLGAAFAASTGGGLALASHLVKATTRLGVNTSPEPFSNVGVSLIEDVSVSVVITTAILWPVIGMSLAVLALILGVVAAVMIWRLARAGSRSLRARIARVRRDRQGGAPSLPTL